MDYNNAIVPDVRFNELEIFKKYINTQNLTEEIKLVHIIIKGPIRDRNYQCAIEFPEDENSYILNNDSSLDDFKLELYKLLNDL